MGRRYTPHASRRRLRRLLSMRGSRSRERDVGQSKGCGFSLFSSCSVLLSTAKSGDPRDNRRREFPVFIPQLTGRGAAPGCGRPPVFPLLFTGKNRRRGGRLRTLPQAPRITTSRGVGGGAVEGLISHGVVATVQKPGTGGRARASRLRAAGGARPMQGRRP